MSPTTSSRLAAIACVALLVAAPVASAQGKRAANGPSAGGMPDGAVVAVQPMPMPHGIVPNRAELPASAFQKLDAASKGYVTLDDVAQLSGFESAFRHADQNRDGRLNASEFNSAWNLYTGLTP